MKKGALGIASIGVVLIGINAAATAAPAHADTSTFLSDMDAAGFYNDKGSKAELSVGYHLCSELGAGMAWADVSYDLWVHTALSVNKDDANKILTIAVKDLCPQFTGGGGSYT
jgi:Protein of unknown function (DUF732)